MEVTMPRFKPVDYQQTQWIGVSFAEQILPGTFEYTLNYLIDHAVDLSQFEARYKNDELGATAYSPAVLLKIILYAYSKGIVSSRDIATCCEKNVTFMALAGNLRPHFTSIADFVSESTEEITSLFRDVLMVCDEEGLIAREMFAVDGCKLPSNASKEWSGTKEDLKKKAGKLQKAIKRIINRHRQVDKQQLESPHIKQEKKKLKTLERQYQKLMDWLEDNDDRRGPTGNVVKSNITDNESAKMSTSHGIIQGYTGVAMVDKEHQVIVHAEAFGVGQENHLLKPLVEGTRETLQEIDDDPESDVFEKTQLTADAGYHSEANMEWLLEDEEIDAYVADNQFRKRDPLFATASRHKPKPKPRKKFIPADFTVDLKKMTCTCPAGKPMYLENSNFSTNQGLKAICFRGRLTCCRPCHLRAQCLRHPDQKSSRQVHFFTGERVDNKETYTEKMKRRIDSPAGRDIYSRRLGTVEPVFGHLRYAIGLDRFNLRSKRKVNAQWLLYCTVHNIKKIFRCADGLAYA
jgi:transposase